MVIANDVRAILVKHNIPVYKLINALGISKSKYYSKLVHTDFKGYRSNVINAFKKLGVHFKEPNYQKNMVKLTDKQKHEMFPYTTPQGNFYVDKRSYYQQFGKENK